MKERGKNPGADTEISVLDLEPEKSEKENRLTKRGRGGGGGGWLDAALSRRKYTHACCCIGPMSAPSSQSIKIGIDLSIDKSIKITKSDLIDIDCIDQSAEIDDTLVSFIDLYRKIYLFICSSKNEN